MNPLPQLRSRLVFTVSAYVLGHPWLYYSATRIGVKRKDLIVDANTELVMEGFPRSGNSFAVYAFLQAQPAPVRLAHHHHAQAQIIRAARKGIPACVFLRDPESAVRSLTVRNPKVDLAYGLNKYIRFYQDILPYRDRYVVAPFEEVTTDLSQTIERINLRFATSFVPFEHIEPNVQKVFEHIRYINQTYNQGSTTVIARPSALKESLKSALSFDGLQDPLARAHHIYRTLLNEAWSTGAHHPSPGGSNA